ncbi:hypothetical protein KSP39_PZI022308 [Platanthera zijinensis]|uniref:Uncharacterized protein n=1 Tax=Platanthera zijinensis TaxID=2320716 RepID=A0AAP0FV15_9ASPA
MAEQWIIDLTKQLDHPPSTDNELWTKSIYRVPKILTDVNRQAYEPRLASFGPYHHGRRHLRPMEHHKHRALIQFLRRIGKASKSPNDVLVAMKQVESSLRFAYDSLQTEVDKDEFLKLMITDGCFALEFMLSMMKRFATEEQSEYDSNDPVFGENGNKYVVPNLKRDMLLLENQLPLLALSTLADIQGSGMGDVNSLIKLFYDICWTSPLQRSFHILEMYRKSMTSSGGYLQSNEETVQSATELVDAGVSICRSDTRSFRDISFAGGKLSVPPLQMDDTTKSILLNLMAFECLHPARRNEVTAYASFMNGLIRTTDDVALLRKEEIITGLVGCDSNIVSMFSRITMDSTRVVYIDVIQIDVIGKMADYCKKNMHKWRASFVHSYLKNPWVFISLISGVILLSLTIVQTVYTELSYYKS